VGRGGKDGKEGEGKERRRREGGKAEGKGREVPYFRLTLLATLAQDQCINSFLMGMQMAPYAV